LKVLKATRRKMARTFNQTARSPFARGYRSGLEDVVADQIKRVLPDFAVQYESQKIQYLKPEKVCVYTPDFVLPNGIIIETKGRFVTADRQKHLLVREQHPELDIRFVFSNSKNRLSKRSRTTYAAWCTKHGFIFADKRIPLEWFK
jgi:hypothetical protein